MRHLFLALHQLALSVHSDSLSTWYALVHRQLLSYYLIAWFL